MAGDALKRSAVMDAAALCETEWSSDVALSLDDAIALLEAGKASGSIKVDFGDGTIKTITSGSGLLQRLKGHRMLLALSDGATKLSAPRGSNENIWIDPDADEILSALPKKS